MKAPNKSSRVGWILASGAAWTIGGYGTAQIIRFGTNLALTRILVPELFGIMLIVNTVRTGIELLSDIGIAQSVIRSSRGEQPVFYNTAWTLQVARGAALFLLCALLAIPVAAVYNISILVYLIPAAGLTLLIAGFTSMSLPLLRRKMSFSRLAAFEVATALLFSFFQVALAFVYPTVWALIVGLVFGSFVNVVGSFFLSNIKPTIIVDRSIIKEIISFGKWITALSAIFFVTTNFDRLYLPSVLSLETLGIFAIARTITDVVGNLFVRLNNSILFPFVASRAKTPRQTLKLELRASRLKFLCVAAGVVGALAASADLLVSFLFDPRYHAAGWMASFLLVGAWFSILASTAEASLLGLGRPQAATITNGAKLIWLFSALPIGFGAHGMIAAVAVISAGDLIRYLAAVWEQKRASFSFLRQDMAASGVFVFLLLFVALARHNLGLPFLV